MSGLLRRGGVPTDSSDRSGHPERLRAGAVQVAAVILSCLVPVLFAVSLVLVRLNHVTRLSVIDEHIHIDYLSDIQSGRLPRRGDLLTQEAMRAWACRGHDAGVPPGVACSDKSYDVREFPLQQSSAYMYFPPYYVAAVATFEVADWLGTGVSLVGWSRALGMVWLAAGLTLTWFALGELRYSLLARSLALLTITLSPLLILTSSVVNPSAVALTVGAAALLCGLRWERCALPSWLLVAVCAVGVALASTNLLGIGIVLLYLLLRTYRHASTETNGEIPTANRTPRATLWLIAAVATVSGVIVFGWSLYVSASATASHKQLYGWAIVKSFPWNAAVTSSLSARFPWYSDGASFPEYATKVGPFTNFVLTEAMILVTLLVFGGLVSLALDRCPSRSRALAQSVLVGLFAFGFVWMTLQYASFHYDLGLSPRYTFAALPAASIGISTLCDHRFSRWVVTPFLASLSIFTMVALVNGPHLGA